MDAHLSICGRFPSRRNLSLFAFRCLFLILVFNLLCWSSSLRLNRINTESSGLLQSSSRQIMTMRMTMTLRPATCLGARWSRFCRKLFCLIALSHCRSELSFVVATPILIFALQRFGLSLTLTCRGLCFVLRGALSVCCCLCRSLSQRHTRAHAHALTHTRTHANANTSTVRPRHRHTGSHQHCCYWRLALERSVLHSAAGCAG